MRLQTALLFALLLIIWVYLLVEWLRLIAYKDPLILFL